VSEFVFATEVFAVFGLVAAIVRNLETILPFGEDARSIFVLASAEQARASFQHYQEVAQAHCGCEQLSVALH
jgi:hypothetical protein